MLLSQHLTLSISSQPFFQAIRFLIILFNNLTLHKRTFSSSSSSQINMNHIVLLIYDFCVSTMQVKKEPSLDALLTDICIGTSAAPTYLPAHYFKTEDKNGEVREFNLIDGGVAANNPVCESQKLLN